MKSEAREVVITEMSPFAQEQKRKFLYAKRHCLEDHIYDKAKSFKCPHCNIPIEIDDSTGDRIYMKCPRCDSTWKTECYGVSIFIHIFVMCTFMLWVPFNGIILMVYSYNLLACFIAEILGLLMAMYLLCVLHMEKKRNQFACEEIDRLGVNNFIEEYYYNRYCRGTNNG